VFCLYKNRPEGCQTEEYGSSRDNSVEQRRKRKRVRVSDILSIRLYRTIKQKLRQKFVQTCHKGFSTYLNFEETETSVVMSLPLWPINNSPLFLIERSKYMIDEDHICYNIFFSVSKELLSITHLFFYEKQLNILPSCFRIIMAYS
jgi:hypothetical protein